MRIISNAPKQEVPAGKRGIRETVWGNVNAYVGGRFWKTLGIVNSVGVDEKIAAWLDGSDKE